ncbi:LysR family transcriptional regulator [Sporosarcina sp. FSL W8-0480]|uniref:LysR family transcriptional regulator n=1 Tax=Sporosarcina sp. FSL W8-0480 TaxID=2954701 RepID=UPI0030DB5649
MNIDHIMSFIYINRFKNFHKAAKTLYISQPSLTSRIKTLEKELGVRLFNRNTKKVELTEDGEIFLPYANQIFNSYLKAKVSLSKSNSSLTIGSIISVSMSILPKVVFDFQQINSHTTIEIITAKTVTMIDKLLRGDCQIAITESVNHPKIISEPIHHDNVSLFVNKSHPFASYNRPITLEEVSGEPLICFNPRSNYWKDISTSFKSNGLPMNVVFNIDSLEAAKSAITKDIGICFLPELSLENDISNGTLIRIPLESNKEFKREITLNYLMDANDEIKRLAEFLLQAFKRQVIQS